MGRSPRKMSNTAGTLLAVLLNPPGSTTGTRTRNAVRIASEVLGFGSVEIANLTSVATRTVLELNRLDSSGWQDARAQLTAGLSRADALLGGWGTTGLSGAARDARTAQVEWFAGEARATGIDEIWTVGDRPRHPSRWHQYVSDKYGRTTGGSFPARLGQVLTRIPLGQAGYSSRESSAYPDSSSSCMRESRHNRLQLG